MDIEFFDMASDRAEQLVNLVIDILQDERKKQSLTLRALAAKADLDPAMLSRVEQRKRIPSFSFFVDWADALSIPIETAIADARKGLNQ